ncbi:MAG: nucleoside deaminase [Pseudomonadota bacterium]
MALTHSARDTADRPLDGMALALDAARAAGTAGEVPVGAVILMNGALIARGENRMRRDTDPTAHAEIVAIRTACRELGTERLIGAHLYVTLEPCTMCAGAIVAARLERVYYGASDPKGGGVEQGSRVFNQPTSNHRPDVYPGLRETECAGLLRAFFHARR